MNRTSRGEIKENKQAAPQNNRNRSAVELEADSPEVVLKERDQPIFDIALIAKQELKSDYKKEISTLLPIRKPNNKKDYFVFGLSDRTNTTESKLFSS